MKKQKFKLKYLAPKGMRVNHGFAWVTGAPSWYWHDMSAKKWRHQLDIRGNISTHARCRTVRAFKRMLRKNPILLNWSPALVHREYISDDGTGRTYRLDVEVTI